MADIYLLKVKINTKWTCYNAVEFMTLYHLSNSAKVETIKGSGFMYGENNVAPQSLTGGRIQLLTGVLINASGARQNLSATKCRSQGSRWLVGISLPQIEAFRPLKIAVNLCKRSLKLQKQPSSMPDWTLHPSIFWGREDITLPILSLSFQGIEIAFRGLNLRLNTGI